MHEFRAETLDKGPLTEREAEILRLICEARSDKDIAALFDISINTVLHHITHIYAKLQIVESRLNRRLVALRVALARGLIRLLLVVLVVGAVDGHDDVARVGRSRLPRPSVTRVRRLDA